jgi:hypothetical protein
VGWLWSLERVDCIHRALGNTCTLKVG